MSTLDFYILAFVKVLGAGALCLGLLFAIIWLLYRLHEMIVGWHFIVAALNTHRAHLARLEQARPADESLS